VKIRDLRVNVYRGAGIPELTVVAELEDEKIADNVWRAGRAIRIEAKGAAGRKEIEALIKDALDRLEATK